MAAANAAGGGCDVGMARLRLDELFISTAIGIEADGFAGAARTRREAVILDCWSYAIIAAPGRRAKHFSERKRDSAMQNLNPTIPLRAAGYMQTWELMETVIPRGEAAEIARLMGYMPDYVRRWRRSPEDGEANDSARRDPVLNLLILFEALRARKLPQMIPVIMGYVQSDIAGGSEVDGQRGVITAAQAESDLRAAAARFIEIADSLARGG